MSSNPLLQTHVLPPFSDIDAKHVVDMVKHKTESNLAELEQQLNDLKEVSWESLVEPLEERGDSLSKSWSPVSHLNLVCNSEELRTEYEQALALLSPYYTALGQNKKLAQAYHELASSETFAKLDGPQKAAIEHALRDFKLSGVDLPEDKQKRYGEIQARLSQLSSSFSNNVLDAGEAWHFQTDDEAQLSGLPDSIKALAAQTAKEKEQSGWLLKLDGPSYVAVMTYADTRELRAKFYEAYNTRASDQGPNAGEWDNSPLIEEIMSLRQELAELLDFTNYAALSLATKMADSPAQVESFLRDLAAKAKPSAQRDLDELRAWVSAEFAVDELAPWDVGYYSEKLRQAKYSVSQEELRQYFTLPKVLDGLFKVAEKLFGIQIQESSDVDLWHEDARFFEIFKNGDKLAAFYLDLYARDKKRGGAWMDVCRTRRQSAEGLQLPVAYLVCNFSAPAGDQPALLTHNDVTTLFHEFGHGLHHMLTLVDVAAVSGISGVEWDAVELPSQFLENWAWQPDVLKDISAHVETGETLPDSLIEKMLAAKNFQSGMFLVRQIEFALFDMLIHRDFGQEAFVGVQGTLDKVREEVAVFVPPAFNRFQNGFSHIFAGGYSAGYYSYLWAEVLSADAFAAFEETSIFDGETGQRFFDEILSRGGSRSAAEHFRAFRGRDAQVDALLRHSGIS